MTKKNFVLDTNVILHDGGCLERFQEHDVLVPMTVIEELDRFKRGKEDINLQARRFLRRLDELTDEVLSEEGAYLGPGLGHIRITLQHHLDPAIKQVFVEDKADHRILNAAFVQQQQDREIQVILVTKDVNLRLKAKSLGVFAQDYTSDKVESFDKIYKGKRLIDNLPSSTIDDFYESESWDQFDELDLTEPMTPNEFFILRSGSKSAMAKFDPIGNRLVRVPKKKAYGITPRNAEQAFALDALLDDSIQLVTIVGKAGTGKTLLALAAALECRTNFRQILLTRPTVPLSDRDIGFLPGDIHSKLDPYMQPLFDNLDVIRHQFDDKSAAAGKINDMRLNDKIVIEPLAYIRGRSLQRIYFIIDEAQNLTPHEVKTIVTRAGEGTKIILTGDIQQIDHPYLDSLSNGMTYLINRMRGQSIYAHISLEKGERSKLADIAGSVL